MRPPWGYEIYTLEYLEELYGGKHRSYNTYDTENRRVRVKLKANNTWIKVTHHNTWHVKTCFAKDQRTGDWRCIELEVPVSEVTKVGYEYEVCIPITSDPQAWRGWAYHAVIRLPDAPDDEKPRRLGRTCGRARPRDQTTDIRTTDSQTPDTQECDATTYVDLG